MTVPVIVLRTNARQYSKLVALGNAVVAGLTGNSSFLTPAIPTVTLVALISDVTNAIALWGDKHNRGSHADLLDLKDKALTLYNNLKSEAAYVQLTAAVAAGNDYSAMAAIIVTSGYSIKASSHHQGGLNKVQNLRFMESGALNRNQVKFVWDRPLEVTSPNNVKINNVYRSTTTNFADAVLIDTVSKNEYVDTNVTGVVTTYSYFVAAVGAAGEGAVSEPITVTLLPA